jgi:hypothetical protein
VNITRVKNQAVALALIASGFVMGLAAPPAWNALTSYAQTGANSNCQTFPQTGHKVCGRFLRYWQAHGGLTQQGYPISEEFVETSDLDGKPYTVQYFERAVFEYHPEYAGTQYEVLLSQLGTYLGREKYTKGFPQTPGVVPFYENREDPAGTLKSFYNAVNRKEYDRAYSYYDGAPNPVPDLAPPYPQFVQGYTTTAEVALAVGKATTGAAAGSIYATMPVVIIATHTDGSKHMFAGCYTLRRANFGVSPDPNDLLWRIYSASIREVPANSPIDPLLAQNCTP